MLKKRRTLLSGIQPSGDLLLGSYFGAIKNWAELAGEYDCFFFIADMHAITVRQNPADLRRRTLQQLAQYIACGIDPETCALFVQSHVSEHAELAWALGCCTMFGELQRMTQFKEKSAKNSENVNAGLFTYPVLMAADILLYQADLVPVGEDQKQHLELTRDIAQRFNGLCGDVFTIPEPYIPKTGARIMSLQDPGNKMSKSDSAAGASVYLLDSPDAVMRAFRRAVTDSGSDIRYDPAGKPGVSNLMQIYSAATGKSFGEIEVEFSGKGYGDFKTAVGETVTELLRPIRERTEDLLKNKDYLASIYKSGAAKASERARRTLGKVYKKLGFAEKA
ncbi:MAG: tryptophan--tRNA ligase [Oscillospiraceae bacterium]|nr:tryptophan--tRNA ligase [Oscillospiraceae bacterium]